MRTVELDCSRNDVHFGENFQFPPWLTLATPECTASEAAATS